MQSPDMYRRLAGDCLRKASNEIDVGTRAIYLTIATAWNTLADRAETAQPQEERSQQQATKHSLH
jgi:hypothetical protein